MKKIFALFALMFLTSCAVQPTNNNTYIPTPSSIQTIHPETTPEPSTQISASIKPIIVCRGNNNLEGYVVGGFLNGKMVNLQDNDNYKLFDLTGKEKYMFFSAKGKPVPINSENFKTNFVAATGTYEIEVIFKDIDKLLDFESRYIGIGNSSLNTVKEKNIINDNGSFLMDFDGDGYSEKIIIHEKESNIIIIILENQQGNYELAKFEVDGTYTISFDLFTVDVDEDGNQELIICLNGHSYSTEVFKISSNAYKKVLGYYMGN